MATPIVTWSQYNQAPGGALLSGSIDASVTHNGGKTWTSPVSISGSFVGFEFASVPVAAADGSIYVAFLSFNEEVAPQFRDHYKVVKVDPNTGHALGAPVEVGLTYDGVHDYPITIEGFGTYQDSEFRAPFPIGNLAADPSNAKHLAVIWSDMRNNPYPGGLLPSADPYQVQTNSDIIISQSFDSGLSWSKPKAINTPNDQFQPWGAYDASGRLQIGYYDRSYDPANHMYGYTLASEKTPGSLKFTFQQVTTVLSDPTQGCSGPHDSIATTVNSNFPNAATFIGDYSNIAISPNGVAALWTDKRLPSTVPGFPGSTADAFFALVPFPDDVARQGGSGADAFVALVVPPADFAFLARTPLSSALANPSVQYPTADDSEFTTPGNQGERKSSDLLTFREHELGHLLGLEHTASGVMVDTLATGTRRTPSSDVVLGDMAVRDGIFADIATSLTTAFSTARSSKRR
jgi:hypothetical protein